MDIMNISNEEVGELVKSDPNMMMFLGLSSRMKVVEDENKKFKAELKTLKASFDNINFEQEIQKEDINKIKKITYVLGSDGGKRKTLTSLINHLCYKNYTEKSQSLKDKLFHRAITKACYKRLYDQFEVSSYLSINLEDFDESLKVVRRWYGNKSNIEKAVKKRLRQYIEDAHLPKHKQDMVDKFMNSTEGGNNIW